MKYLLATLGGAVLTLCIFAGGIAFAITYLAADRVPVERPSRDASLVFRADAVKVNPKQQDYERVEPRDIPERTVQTGSFIADVDLVPEIDDIQTAALPDAHLPGDTSLSDEHINWCRERYRSYRPESNSYRPYAGGSRECVSPFSEETTVAAEDEAVLIEASNAEYTSGLNFHQAASIPSSDEHIMSCFERYRSYRPSDNTYQPYNGGPRLQCQ